MVLNIILAVIILIVGAALIAVYLGKEKASLETKELKENLVKEKERKEFLEKRLAELSSISSSASEERARLFQEKMKLEEKAKKTFQMSEAVYREKKKVEEIKEEIEVKHRDVTESITYAKRIQSAILPLKEQIIKEFPNNFILYRPRDIVSGDFYWFNSLDDSHYFAAVDCTGHGVPGAFMSMIGYTLLNEIVMQKKITNPGQILVELDNSVRHILKQDEKQNATRDGMDLAFCVYHPKTKRLDYAGAHRPLWLIRNGSSDIEEIKATKSAIGGLRQTPANYETHSFDMNEGDQIYIFTDGYADQFSPTDKKLMTRKFKEIVLSNKEKPMQEQGKQLEDAHVNWKLNMEQTDDVLVMGFRF